MAALTSGEISVCLERSMLRNGDDCLEEGWWWCFFIDLSELFIYLKNSVKWYKQITVSTNEFKKLEYEIIKLSHLWEVILDCVDAKRPWVVSAELQSVSYSVSIIQPQGTFHAKCIFKWRKEGNVLFNDTLNTFYYGYMASDIW